LIFADSIEALDHPDPGDGLLDDLGDIGGPLGGEPGRRQQPPPGAAGGDGGQRHDEDRDEGQDGGEVEHRGEGDDQQDDAAERQRHHHEQSLHELQVVDDPRDDLPDTQLVLANAVESLERPEDPVAEVELDLQRQRTAEVAAGEGQREVRNREEQQDEDRSAEVVGAVGDRVVHRVRGEQRDDPLDRRGHGGRAQTSPEQPPVFGAGRHQSPDPPGTFRSGARSRFRARGGGRGLFSRC
jgi:hypothetical protein